MILNLFEEIEFFKNLEVGIITPLILTSIFIPSMIIQLLPFIIFISSMWFMIKIRNNRDLLTMKVFGYSNIKIFFDYRIFFLQKYHFVENRAGIEISHFKDFTRPYSCKSKL